VRNAALRPANALALLLAALAPAAAAAPLQDAAWRVRMARIECSGPLVGLRLESPGGDTTEVELELAGGERRTIGVPAVPLPGSADLPPTVVPLGAGSARFADWDDAWSGDLEERWELLPASLRLRPRPVPADGTAHSLRVPLAALLLAAAGFLAALHLRRRGAWALLAGCATVLVVLAAGDPRPQGGRVLEVLEGDGGDDRWVALRVAHGRLELAPGERALIASSPGTAPMQLRMDGGPGGSWELRARGADLYAFVPRAAGAGGVRRGEPNGLDDFYACWLRSEAGEWSFLGPWPRGTALPATVGSPTGSTAPPGWLQPALPPGRSVFLGRRIRPESPASAESWVRVIGF
jgi:hypothetical protein